MAGNSKDSKILAYKDMINQLNKTISAQTELIKSLQKTLEAGRLEKENLRQQIEYLTKKLFGTSSEKRKDIDGQLNLFDEAEQEADPTWKQELPDDITVPEHKRKARRTHADLFKNIPSCDEIISLPEEERNCPTCGTQMECIGKEFVRHEFRFTPAKGKVVNIYRETYKCPECAISEEHPDEQTFVKAPVQDPLIPESYASESVVGWAMHQKYQNGLPLNRQESEWTQLGIPLSRATLANWIIYCAKNYLCHVYDYFHRQLRMRKYLMADETRVQVLNEPERNPETDSWMWLFRSGEDGLPPILEAFWNWLDQQRPNKGTRLAKAVNYAQNRKDTLMTYLEDGHCSLSNNLSENAIRPFTVGRKNWLFSASPKGAASSAIVYTMVEMAKANDLNTYKYLTYLLSQRPDAKMSDEQLEQLAPWSETAKANCQN